MLFVLQFHRRTQNLDCGVGLDCGNFLRNNQCSLKQNCILEAPLKSMGLGIGQLRVAFLKRQEVPCSDSYEDMLGKCEP